MPVIKSAKKKLKQDLKRKKRNSALKELFTKTLKKARKAPTEKTVRDAVSLVDKATKHNLIHKNKGARIKSKLSKLVAPKTKPQKTVSATKKPKKSA